MGEYRTRTFDLTTARTDEALDVGGARKVVVSKVSAEAFIKVDSQAADSILVRRGMRFCDPTGINKLYITNAAAVDAGAELRIIILDSIEIEVPGTDDLEVFVSPQGGTNVIEATIANGASQSGEIDLGSGRLLAIFMPAAWTAAALTFLAAHESGGTFQDVYGDDGTEESVTAAASRVISIDDAAGVLASLRYIKLRSGTTGTPVNQGAERTIYLITKQ